MELFWFLLLLSSSVSQSSSTPNQRSSLIISGERKITAWNNGKKYFSVSGLKFDFYWTYRETIILRHRRGFKPSNVSLHISSMDCGILNIRVLREGVCRGGGGEDITKIPATLFDIVQSRRAAWWSGGHLDGRIWASGHGCLHPAQTKQYNQRCLPLPAEEWRRAGKPADQAKSAVRWRRMHWWNPATEGGPVGRTCVSPEDQKPGGRRHVNQRTVMTWRHHWLTSGAFSHLHAH